MYYTLRVVVKMCINCSYLHLYLLYSVSAEYLIELSVVVVVVTVLSGGS